MTIIDNIRDKWQRNSNIYADAYRKGKIAGFDYTLLLWKNHTKFLLRLRNPEDKKAEIRRMNLFWERFLDVIKPYEQMPVYPLPSTNSGQGYSIDDGKDAIIWVYWNDISTMPVMVEKCIERIRKNSNGHQVVIVTEETVSDYLQLDDVVLRKYKEGKISRTHFCDIVRISLLNYYGGVWMDCTLLLTQPLPEIVTSSVFYTNRLNNWDDNNVGGGRWSTFFLACHRGNLMMKATLDVFVEYWHRYDDIVDYVWMDYIFNLLYNNIPSVKDMIDSVPENNPDIWIMQTKIAHPFSKDEFEAIISDKSRFLYKFSYKDSKDVPYHDESGHVTLMGRICGQQ
jgi:hypothetical protein